VIYKREIKKRAMRLSHKDQKDEKVQAYKQEFQNYINNLNDQNGLYKTFTEITILRIKLDKNDSIFKNFKDALERNTICNVKELIILQFNDIMTTCKSYKKTDYELIDSTMKNILPTNVPNSNWIQSIFEWIQSGLDNATGRKK
jgi:hypothetical protein